MKTLVSSGVAAWLVLGLMGCAGADGHEDASDTGTTATAQPGVASVSDIPPVVTSDPPSPSGSNMPPTSFSGPPLRLPPELIPPVTRSDDSGSAPVAPSKALEWRACGQFEDRDIECAELDVPIDYAEPAGDQVTLALRRILANPLEPYHGALFFNPGGPGGPGIDTALSLFEGHLFDEVAPGFDIIGFDPRGVAESGERGCGITPPNLYPGVQAAPRDLNLEDYLSYYRSEGAQCEQKWGALFRHLGSNNVVKDMEEMRKALNEPVLNFYGGSYGTRLGALYAHQYPKTTGRVVLDAPVSPSGSVVELIRGQFYEELTLNEQIFAACEAGTVVCTPNARRVFDQVIANARGRSIEQQVAATWGARLESPEGVQQLLAALAAEAADPGGDWILSFIGGESSGQGFVAFASVMCSDDTLDPPTTEQLANLQAEFEQASAVFGSYALTASLCAGWPVTRDPVPLPTASEAPPVLVIGGTADSRTPYPWAQAMTETLGNATLLTSVHWGHGAILHGSDCALQAIRAYLTSGSLPASGAQCQ